MYPLKNLPGWVFLVLLAVLMAIGTAGSLWVAGMQSDPMWQGFWGGIATTCIGIFGTVFLVNQLLRRVDERRRLPLALHVRQRVSRIAFYETDRLIALLQEQPDGETRPQPHRDTEDINRLPDGYTLLVDTTIDGLKRRLPRLEAGDWASFDRTIDRTAREYARLISLFGYEMDADMLRLMLRAEESAHRLSGIMSERADLSGHEPHAGDGDHDDAAIMTKQTLDLIALHLARIMRANVEMLRRA